MGKHTAEGGIETPAPQQQPIIVVGSASWDNWGAIESALDNATSKHPQPIILTSGCPTGAEWFAREYAKGRGWTVHEMRDEEFIRVEHAIVIAFIRNESSGATRVTNQLRNKFWTQTMTDNVAPQHTGWEER